MRESLISLGWKPSEGQMEELQYVTNVYMPYNHVLKSLYNDLKKLISMTSEQFKQEYTNLTDQMRELRERHRELEQVLLEYTRNYVEETFKASGYRVGQKITDDRGRVWYVSGARECCYRVVLSLNPAKKDGTMSKVTYIGRGEPRLYVN